MEEGPLAVKPQGLREQKWEDSSMKKRIAALMAMVMLVGNLGAGFTEDAGTAGQPMAAETALTETLIIPAETAEDAGTLPAETAESGEPTEGGEAVQSGESTEGGEAVQSGESTEGGETVRNGGSTEGGETVQNGEPTEGGETVQNGEPTEGGETVRNGVSTEGGEATENNEPAEGGETTKNNESAEGGETTKNNESAEGGEAQEKPEPAQPTARHTITVVARSSLGNVYDGTEKGITGFDTLTFTVDGETYTVSGLTTSDPRSVDVCSRANEISGTAVVTSASGENVTDRFTVNTQNGLLTVVPRVVVLTSADDTKEYDGTPLTRNNPADVTVSGDGFAAGEGASWEITGSQTLVGASDNRFTYTLTGGAKPENYEITVRFGSLTVTDRSQKYALTVEAESGAFVYDGTEHSVSGLRESAFTVAGQRYTVAGLSASARRTDAGETAVAITGAARVLDAGGQDVTSQFIVTKKNGLLTVAKAPLTVTTGSASKAYDGTALTKDEAEITGLVNGEQVSARATGSQTEVGESPNTCRIAWGAVRAENYEITERLGTLTVTVSQTAITLTAASGEKTYDGTPLTDSRVTAAGLPAGFTADAAASGSQTAAGESANTVADGYVIRNARGEDRTASFGNVSRVDGLLRVNPAELTVTTGSGAKRFDGEPLTVAEAAIAGLAGGETATARATGSQTEVGSSPNTVEMAWGTADPANYRVTEKTGTLTVTENTNQVTLTAASDVKEYDGTPLVNTGVTAAGLPEGFTVRASAHPREDVTDHLETYEPNNFVDADYAILDRAGVDRTGWFRSVTLVPGTLRITPKKVYVRTASATKKYDGTPLQNPDAEVIGLVEGDIGFAFASGSQTEVGESLNTYLDEDLILTPNYVRDRGLDELGTLRVVATDVDVAVIANSESREYDGTPLTNPGITLWGLPEGYSVRGAAVGSQTDVGVGRNEVADGFVILDPNGQDVTGSFANVKRIPGELRVRLATLTVTTGSASKAYDGTALQETAYTTLEGLAEGETVTVTATGSQTDVGESENTFRIEWGGVNSANYTVVEKRGVLTVTPNASGFTLQAGSAERPYDGTALTSAEVTSDLPGALAIEAETEGTQTRAGSSANQVKAGWRILDAAGNDVTSYFTNVGTAEGTLTVTRAPVTITTGSAEKPYDGEALTSPEITIEGLAEGESVTLEAVGSQTLVGESENVYTITWDQAEAENYEVTDALGVLSVTSERGTVEPAMTTPETEKRYGIGDVIPFEITVRNISDAEALNLTVSGGTATVLPGAGYTAVGAHEALITAIPAGGTVTIRLQHTVTAEDIAAGRYESAATIRTADGAEYAAAAGTDRLAEAETGLNVTAEVANAHEDGSGFGLGETITFRVTVTNSGNVDLARVSVRDETTGLTQTLETLRAGASAVLTAEHTVTGEDLQAGEVVSAVTAEADLGGETLRAEASATAKVSRQLTLTIRRWVDRTVLLETERITMDYGTAYDLPVREREGFEADRERITGTLTEDATVDVFYTRRVYTLTVIYRYVDGSAAAGTYTERVAYGRSYSVASPMISGYTMNRRHVLGNMPASNLTVTVIYAPDDRVIDIEELETPLGLGALSVNLGEAIE